MPKRSKTESAKSKVESASALAAVGGAIGWPLGAGIGAVTGLIIGDGEVVLPLDMVAIPAYQAYMISGTPALQIYMRAGETLVPTGGNVKDVQEAIEESGADSLHPSLSMLSEARGGRKPTAYQKRYKKAFKSIAPKHKLKNGKWKKNGFRAAVKAAHKEAGGKK